MAEDWGHGPSVLSTGATPCEGPTVNRESAVAVKWMKAIIMQLPNSNHFLKDTSVYFFDIK
jgi:hypothetical protein